MTFRTIWAASMLAIMLDTSAAAADLPFVNWENFPVNPMDISPDGRSMALTHTADNRIQLFDVSEGRAVQIGHVVVGVDPMAVRFRTDTELWVVNHVSDTVSVVDIEAGRVIRTLETLDEPADVVFAGNPIRAYVSCSQANTVMVFDPENLDAAATLVAIDAEDPRSLAVSPDGRFVYAAIFESGNGTTLMPGGVEEPDVFTFPPNVARMTSSPYAGQNPPPNSGNDFSPAISP
jgi:YVTN family beta-propeller protein